MAVTGSYTFPRAADPLFQVIFYHGHEKLPAAVERRDAHS